MPIYPPLPENVIEGICNVLGETTSGFTGPEITKLLNDLNFPDPEPSITKRKRMLVAVSSRQLNDRSANNVYALIHHAMDPVKYVGKRDLFESRRLQLNQILAFQGLEINNAGKLVQVKVAATLDEAELRASRLQVELKRRGVHSDVLKFCKKEFLEENFFHAVLEATKSVADKLRKRTGLTMDGSELVDEAFSFRKNVPYLALSKLQTETEQSEQSGFMNLLKGMFGTFRNPTAHEGKINWPVSEMDALDLLTLASYAHRRIDQAIRTPRQSN